MIRPCPTPRAPRNCPASHACPVIRRALWALMALALTCIGGSVLAAESEIGESLKRIASTDGSPEMDRAAASAARQLQALPSSQVTKVLAGFENSTQRGVNWLRAIAADVSDNGPFQETQLRNFFADGSNDPDARYVAYQLLTQHDRDLSATLLESAETDPSLPLRFLKIQSLIDQGTSIMSENPEKAKQIFRQVISNGRSPNQLEKASRQLGELGVDVNLADELGMMRRWWIVGPFDNTDSKNFDTAYVPENRYLESGVPFDSGASDSGASDEPKPEQGKKGTVNWQLVESNDSLGMVDLNTPLSNEKDAAAYAFAKFTIRDGESISTAQARLGCITANKVWVNGKLVFANEVYHSGTRIDQYVDDCELVAGENTVMIKVMQNAQTEPWAQDWQFQFRLTRPDGSAIKTDFARQ